MKPIKWRQTSSFARVGDLQLDVDEQSLRVWSWHVWDAERGGTIGRGTSTSQAGARAQAKRCALKAIEVKP